MGGDQTAVFLLFPFLTLTVYNYAVEPHQKTTPTAKIKWFSHWRYIGHLQELRRGPYIFFSADNLHCFACNFLVFTV